jgi:multidrug efflux pump subunit AcrA (membrane-fusion protein)
MLVSAIKKKLWGYMNLKKIFLFFCSFVGITFMSCAALAAKENIPLVTAQKIELTESAEILVYPAKVESKIHSVVLAESEGVVRDIKTIGSEVSRGATVLSIRNSDPVYQYAPVLVKSPVNGVLSEVFVTEGAQVIRGEKLATIIDPNQIRISVEVPNSDLMKIVKGQAGTFQLNSLDKEEKAEVEVIGISPLVNNLTGTATAILLFKSKNIFRAGALGKVEFKILAEKQILVDENSVVYKNALPFVRVIEKETAKYRQVTLGSRQSGKIIISKGLQVGEVIVQKSSQYIPDNKKIKVQE